MILDAESCVYLWTAMGVCLLALFEFVTARGRGRPVTQVLDDARRIAWRISFSWFWKNTYRSLLEWQQLPLWFQRQELLQQKLQKYRRPRWWKFSLASSKSSQNEGQLELSLSPPHFQKLLQGEGHHRMPPILHWRRPS